MLPILKFSEFDFFVFFLECSCDPAGAQEVPGYPLGGCGAHVGGQLCECKDKVAGRICDACKPNYWNLDLNNAEGCEGDGQFVLSLDLIFIDKCYRV